MVGWKKLFGRKDEAPGPATPVIHFTEQASAMLRQVMEQKGVLATAALRIQAERQGAGEPNYGMSLEESGQPGPDDVLLDLPGLRVLVARDALSLVDGATVDFMDDPLRPGFHVEPPGSPPPPPAAPRPTLDMSDPIVQTVQQVIDYHVNPAIAGHGGRAALIDVREDVVYVELGGGCQGCAMAAVTLKQGVEHMIKEAVPSVREVVDVTDHAGGSNPYFQSSKGAESPFHEAAKS